MKRGRTSYHVSRIVSDFFSAFVMASLGCQTLGNAPETVKRLPLVKDWRQDTYIICSCLFS